MSIDWNFMNSYCESCDHESCKAKRNFAEDRRRIESEWEDLLADMAKFGLKFEIPDEE